MEKKNNEVTFEELLSQTMKEIKIGQTVTGTVIEITPKNEVFIDIGYKADGIIPANEYILNAGETVKSKFKIGDIITAVVVRLNDGLGNVLLSYNKARKEIDIKEFESKVNNDEVFNSIVEEVKDKGLLVNFNTIRIFIPLSLSGIPRAEDPHTYKGKEIRYKVIEYNPENNRIIGSARAILDAEKESKEKAFWDSIEVGKQYTGTVTSLSEYGAFVDIQGIIQGLLHISEMTWERDKKPKDILKVGQEIGVSVKELDKENKRIKLVYDKKGPNPWSSVEGKYKVSDIVTVEVLNFAPFGAFVKVDNGVEGLIHISQICQKRITKPEEVLQVGQKVNAKIISLDAQNKKMELSIREIEGTSDDTEVAENGENAMVEASESALNIQGEKAIESISKEKSLTTTAESNVEEN